MYTIFSGNSKHEGQPQTCPSVERKQKTHEWDHTNTIYPQIHWNVKMLSWDCVVLVDHEPKTHDLCMAAAQTDGLVWVCGVQTQLCLLCRRKYWLMSSLCWVVALCYRCGGQGQQLIRLDMTGERGKREERTTAQQREDWRTDINDLALLRDQPWFISI